MRLAFEFLEWRNAPFSWPKIHIPPGWEDCVPRYKYKSCGIALGWRVLRFRIWHIKRKKPATE